MSTIWELILSQFPRHPAAGPIVAVSLLLFGGHLLLRVIALFLAFRLSRRAIEEGYPVEASAGREFYFKMPARSSASRTNIARPSSTLCGARIKEIRAEQNRTLSWLSHAAQISASRLSGFETGRARPQEQDIDAIGKALHLGKGDIANLKRLAKRDTEMSND
ncbi:helix-turn-helix transcriptional regulator [Frankia sp. RB7]|nr:helix-turn-helix transcriptional regulator [Frankia sp. RB7]